MDAVSTTSCSAISPAIFLIFIALGSLSPTRTNDMTENPRR